VKYFKGLQIRKGVTNSERFLVLTFSSKGRIRPKNTKMSIYHHPFVVEENIYC
jgi:hypothetical protein